MYFATRAVAREETRAQCDAQAQDAYDIAVFGSYGLVHGNAVAVPKAYYKALLRLSKGEYIGAGFYLEHKAEIADGDYKDYAMSLKELEAKTGMTFFVNLPADKAAAIKAENPKDKPFWNLK